MKMTGRGKIIEFSEYVYIDDSRFYVLGEYSNRQGEFIQWAIFDGDTEEWVDPDNEQEILDEVWSNI